MSHEISKKITEKLEQREGLIRRINSNHELVEFTEREVHGIQISIFRNNTFTRSSEIKDDALMTEIVDIIKKKIDIDKNQLADIDMQLNAIATLMGISEEQDQ